MKHDLETRFKLNGMEQPGFFMPPGARSKGSDPHDYPPCGGDDTT